MSKPTIGNAENHHRSDIIEQIRTSMGRHDTTIILKDGRRLIGRIIKTIADDNQSPSKSDDRLAKVTVHHDIGTFDLDLTKIASVIPGRVG